MIFPGRCCFDGSVDRMGDRIAVNGWELGAYRKNPTVLWAHDSSAPPIDRMVRDFVANEKLMGDVQFASADVYPFADTIYRLVTEGFIKAGSVGFLPIEWKFADDKSRPMGIDFRRQELLEFSMVPVPANANALITGRRRPLSPITRGIWLRISGRSASPPTASPQA
jgi:HK97 family phage prohead protease